jgi:hypothetical protein
MEAVVRVFDELDNPLAEFTPGESAAAITALFQAKGAIGIQKRGGNLWFLAVNLQAGDYVLRTNQAFANPALLLTFPTGKHTTR